MCGDIITDILRTHKLVSRASPPAVETLKKLWAFILKKLIYSEMQERPQQSLK